MLSLGDSVTATLVARLDDPSMSVRWELVSLLGAVSDPAAIGPLVERVLDDENPHVRWRSLWALGRYDDPSLAVERLLAGLESGDSQTRMNAAVGLSMFDRPEGLALLHGGVLNLDPWRRWEAINALGRVHDESTLSVLRPMLSSSHVRDRNETVLVLGRIGGARAAELAVLALKDPDPGVRWRACLTLRRIGDDRALPALERLAAGDEDRRVLEYAGQAIERINARLR